MNPAFNMLNKNVWNEKNSVQVFPSEKQREGKIIPKELIYLEQKINK